MLQDIIQKHQLGCLIFWRPDELVMTLGYMPFWGLSFLMYTADEDPVLFIPELEPADSLPKDITIKRFPWGILSCVDPWKELFIQMKSCLEQKKLRNLPVSFIPFIGGSAPARMSAEQPPLPNNLISALTDLSIKGWTDTDKDLLMLYSYKTLSDIRQIKFTHQVGAIAINTFFKYTVEGSTEAEVAAAVEYEVSKCVNNPKIFFSKAWVMIQSGENAAFAGRFNKTSSRQIRNGDLVIMEIAICVNGYWADLTRTAKVGTMSEKQLHIYRLVKDSQKIGIDMMRPGINMAEIDKAVRTHIQEAGFDRFFNHVLGHHVGFRYHDIGPLLSPNSSSVLEEGMLLTVEPGIYGEEINMGVRIEDNVLIVNDGCVVLSSYPILERETS